MKRKTNYIKFEEVKMPPNRKTKKFKVLTVKDGTYLGTIQKRKNNEFARI